MTAKFCVNCPGAIDHTTEECPFGKQPIDYGALDPQQRLDVARGVDHDTKDCTRLPVVSSLGDYPEIWLAPKCHDDYREWCQDDVWGECGELHDGGEPCAYQSVRYVHGRLLTDAQALIAELREELRTSNECLDMANELCAKYKARIAQLQAAPAESGAIVLPGHPGTAWIDEHADTLDRLLVGRATEGDQMIVASHLQECDIYEDVYAQLCDMIEPHVERPYQSGWLPGSVVDSMRYLLDQELARLNPAPATADSDVREVSE